MMTIVIADSLKACVPGTSLGSCAFTVQLNFLFPAGDCVSNEFFFQVFA